MGTSKLTSAVAGILLAVAASLSHAVVVQLDTTAGGLGGSNTFSFSEITLTTENVSTITVTDTDMNGVLNASFGDTFSETGLVAAVNFVNPNGIGNVSPAVSGLNINYNLFAVFAPPEGGPLIGAAGIVGTTAIGVFTPPTAATIYYDTNIADGVFHPASSTNIGELTLAGGLSNCELPSFGAAQGSCVINFMFDAGGVTAAGVWTFNGTDLGLLDALARVDLNVDALDSPFTIVYPGGVGSSQVRTTRQDGSAVFLIPEPGTLGLLGLALVLLAGGTVRRRRG